MMYFSSDREVTEWAMFLRDRGLLQDGMYDWFLDMWFHQHTIGARKAKRYCEHKTRCFPDEWLTFRAKQRIQGDM